MQLSGSGSHTAADPDRLSIVCNSGGIERSCRPLFVRTAAADAVDEDPFKAQLKREAKAYAASFHASEREYRLRELAKLRPSLNTRDQTYMPGLDEESDGEEDEDNVQDYPAFSRHSLSRVELVSEEDLILEQILALSLLEQEQQTPMEKSLVLVAPQEGEDPVVQVEDAYSLISAEEEDEVRSTTTWTDAGEETASEWSACDQHLSFRHAVLAASSASFGAPVHMRAPPPHSALKPSTAMKRPVLARRKDGVDDSAVDFEGRYLEWKSDSKHARTKRKSTTRRTRFH